MAFKAPEKKETPKAPSSKPVSAKSTDSKPVPVPKPAAKSGGTSPKPFVIKDGQFVPNPARKSGGQGTAKPTTTTSKPTSTTNPKPFVIKDGQFVPNPARKSGGQGTAKPTTTTSKPTSTTNPKPFVIKDGQFVPNPARFAKASQATAPTTPKVAGKSAAPASTQNPVRQQVAAVASKPVREALYGLAATIEAIKKIDPKQAQALQRQFDALVKQKNLTADQVQRVTGGLFNSGQALANSKGLSQPNASMNGTVFGQQIIKNYDAYIGQSKNTNIPGIGNLFGYRNLPKNTPENAALAAVVGSGMMVGSIDGLKNALGNVINKVGSGKVATPTQTSSTSFVNTPETGPQSNSNSRSSGLRQIKYDLKIPLAQQPLKVTNDTLLTDKAGKPILDANKNPIRVREYYYKTPDGRTVIIQEHSLGHDYGGQGDQPPHFNVRPIENTRTGSVPGTQEHYYFLK